jgi:membrane protease YdiL (CAAX protease family)
MSGRRGPGRRRPPSRPTVQSPDQHPAMLGGVSNVPPGVTYPAVLSQQPPGRAVLGIVLALAGYTVVTAVVSSAVVGAGYLAQQPGVPLGDYRAAAASYQNPVGFLAQSLSIAAVIGVCWALMRWLHGLPLGWLSSVRPGLRWRYLGWCLLAAAVVVYGIVAVTAVVGPQPLVWRPQPGLVAVLLVVVLVTPLQSAAEEYLFRGYLLQTMGSFFPTPWVGVILSSLLFAALHGSQNLPLFVNRLAFGLLAATLVLATGGLEAGIAAHIINNVGAYTLAGFTASIADLRAVRSLGWSDALLDVAGFALFAVVAVLLARRLRLPVTTPATPTGSGGRR